MIPHNVALSVDETDQMSDLLAAKYIARADELTPVMVDATGVILAARLSRYLYEQRNRPDEDRPLRDACVFCEGLLMEDRVTVDKRNRVVTPCWACRPRAFCAYHAMIARHEESQAAEHFCCGHYLGYMRECPTCKAPCRCSGCKADDAPATLRTACNWCGSAECRAPVDHMVQLCGSDARWSLECAACHKCLTGGASYVALGVFAEHHEAHGLACRWASPEFHSNRSREDWDEHDDKSDVLPNDSRTSYPWGGR